MQSKRLVAMIAGASVAIAQAFAPGPFGAPLLRGAASGGWPAGTLMRTAHGYGPVHGAAAAGRRSARRAWAKKHVVVFAMSEDKEEAARNAEELKTGVQLRSPDVDKLCAWLAEEIKLWLDESWIERDVHRLMGEQAASTVRKMVEGGQAGISNILFGVAEDLGVTNFPRLFESDVNEWDVANKVSDLLLQSMGIDVCCTTPPITGLPDYGAAMESSSPAGAVVDRFQAPESTVDKYIFLQKALDGRVSPQDLNAAVLLALKDEDIRRMGVIDRRTLNFFGDDVKAIEDLDEALQDKLKTDNKRDSDLDPLLESLFGEEMLKVAREQGEADFLRREACVKWLHVAGGY